MTNADLETWAARLQRVVDERCERLRRVRVVAETVSTQDAARRFGPTIGDVVPAVRQLSGRGRYGRRWLDTRHEGVAVSFVVPADRPERLVHLTAVATAEAVEELLGRRVNIKWPNDIYVDGRKLAGVLVERTGEAAIIGIGINVGQVSWPGSLQLRAVSLRQLGSDASRLETMESLLPAADDALGRDERSLARAFTGRQVTESTVR